MHHDPLVVPARDPLRLLEQRHALELLVLARAIDDLVVEADEQQLQLRDDDVLVVARVADQRAALLVAGQVVAVELAVRRRVAADEQLDATVGRTRPLVHERVVVGPRAVQAVQVEARRAEVDERVRVVVLLQLGHRVERDVVIDELPEVRVARRDLRVVAGGRRAALLDELGERRQRGVVWFERLRVAEHAPEAALVQRRQRHLLLAAHLRDPVARGAERRAVGLVLAVLRNVRHLPTSRDPAVAKASGADLNRSRVRRAGLLRCRDCLITDRGL